MNENIDLAWELIAKEENETKNLMDETDFSDPESAKATIKYLCTLIYDSKRSIAGLQEQCRLQHLLSKSNTESINLLKSSIEDILSGMEAIQSMLPK